MDTPQQLLGRLDAIGRSLAATDGALALMGLGSLGLEQERLDGLFRPRLLRHCQTGLQFEQRFLGVAQHLPTFVQGYDRSAESAAAILEFLVAHFEVNPVMVAAIRLLLPPPASQGPTTT